GDARHGQHDDDGQRRAWRHDDGHQERRHERRYERWRHDAAPRNDGKTHGHDADDDGADDAARSGNGADARQITAAFDSAFARGAPAMRKSALDFAPGQRRQMSQRMERLSKLMHRMSSLQDRPAMKSPESQKQMDQMRKQMDGMKRDSSMQSPAK